MTPLTAETTTDGSKRTTIDAAASTEVTTLRDSHFQHAGAVEVVAQLADPAIVHHEAEPTRRLIVVTPLEEASAYATYQASRSNLALTPAQLININPIGLPQFGVGPKQFRGSCFYLLFQMVPMARKLLVPLLNFRQHTVEAIDQLPQFVVRAFDGAGGVVLLGGNDLGCGTASIQPPCFNVS